MTAGHRLGRRLTAELKVALAENAQVTAVVRASLADIKQGSFAVAGLYHA
jgi:hypothetical protein